jgi:nucleotide-binding universal stress UspA family protein
MGFMVTKVKNKFRYNNVILIPTDFSEVCNNAIQHGVELAQFLNYKVCILHVIDRKTEAQLEKDHLVKESIEQKLKAYVELYEKQFPVMIDTLTREGNLFKVIGQVATEIKANLMVMGTHGKQGLQHLFGSHALKVVLDSPCPVVVVQKRSFGEGYHKIVLPVSGDIEPRQAVEWVLLMSQLFNSKILIYQSHEPDSSLNNRLNIITRQITEIFKEKNIIYEIKLAEKTTDYSSQVISYAVKNLADMIMIMTMPAIDLTGFSFSAWDERMMFNEAQIPVMCINPIELGDYYYEWMN